MIASPHNMKGKTMQHFDLKDTVTTKDMLTIFGVTSETTIWKWRKFGKLDECAIRIDANERHFIRFKLPCVLKWAKKTNHDTPGLEQWRKKHQGGNKRKRVRAK